MPVKNTKAAPAANTPFLTVSQDGGCSLNIVLYLVWYAFRTEPASKHASAMMNVILRSEIYYINIINKLIFEVICYKTHF
ncbi:hypothetical protein Hanom_Chr08g00737431 [Helianthus anomalus]